MQEEYFRKGQEIKVPVPIKKEILQKARTVIALANKGIVSTYTDLPKFIKDIKLEIENNHEN